jgi:hypothetical protein
MGERHPVTVVFQAIGRDNRIAGLDFLTNTPLYNKKRRLPCDEGEVAYFTELAIVAEAEDAGSALELAQKWIESHYELLQDVDAELMIEFQTAITPKWGSNLLTLPAPFVKLLASLNTRFVHQYSRVFSDVELEQLRREGRGPRRDSPT